MENGEFLKAGSQKYKKTDVRIVATNVTYLTPHDKGRKFREDPYYRLSSRYYFYSFATTEKTIFTYCSENLLVLPINTKCLPSD
jgi:hypothetical protein